MELRVLGWRASGLYERRQLLDGMRDLLMEAHESWPPDVDPTRRTRTDALIEAWEAAHEYAGMPPDAAAWA